jgi:C1A family cysteine protease
MSTPSAQRPFGMGCVRQQPDARDLMLADVVPGLLAAPLPASFDTTHFLPPIKNQGSLNACQSYAANTALSAERAKQGLPYIEASNVWTYWFARKREGTQGQNIGATIRDAMKSLANEGQCPMAGWPDSMEMAGLDPEATWKGLAVPWNKPPYTVNGYQLSADPQTLAHKHRSITYRSVPATSAAIKASIAHGSPVVVGHPVYDSFWGIDSGGIGYVPSPTETLHGYHAETMCAFDDNMVANGHTGYVKVANQWSANFGQSGFWWCPYDWIDSPNPSLQFFDCWVQHFAQ